MKAIRVHEFGPPEVMKLEEAADLRPGPGQVLVRIKAAGVNPVDAYVRSGIYARRPALPYTPGADAAGVVEAVGEGVSRVAAGARVFLSGTLPAPTPNRPSAKNRRSTRCPTRFHSPRARASISPMRRRIARSFSGPMPARARPRSSTAPPAGSARPPSS